MFFSLAILKESDGYANFNNPKFGSMWLDYNTATDRVFNGAGNNPTQAYSSTYLTGNKLLQSTWRNNQGYVRTINIPDIPNNAPDNNTPIPTPNIDEYSITFEPSIMNIGINNNYN